MERNMNDIDYRQITKWIIIVIVVGFPGQFGKSFVPYLIERVRKKEARAASKKSELFVSQPAEPDRRKAITDTTEAKGKAEKRPRRRP